MRSEDGRRWGTSQGGHPQAELEVWEGTDLSNVCKGASVVVGGEWGRPVWPEGDEGDRVSSPGDLKKPESSLVSNGGPAESRKACVACTMVPATRTGPAVQ